MGDKTKIEWCDKTFNPWEGCTQISAACDNCFAIRELHRFGKECCGNNPRKMMAESTWEKPLAWNRRANREGRRFSVFCGSHCDVFEARYELIKPRRRLWSLINATPNLDWLLLTKRPLLLDERPNSVLGSVYVGATAENHVMYDKRVVGALEATRPGNLFVSMEPLLGQVDLSWYIEDIDGVIVGGESGPSARPMHPDWVRSIRDQCVAAGVPFFFKQWGEYAPHDVVGSEQAWKMHDRYRRGSCSPDLIRYFHPNGDLVPSGDGCTEPGYMNMYRVGKQKAGRLLDGVEWNELSWRRS